MRRGEWRTLGLEDVCESVVKRGKKCENYVKKRVLDADGVPQEA
jgi:hypothetical protein